MTYNICPLPSAQPSASPKLTAAMWCLTGLRIYSSSWAQNLKWILYRGHRVWTLVKLGSVDFQIYRAQQSRRRGIQLNSFQECWVPLSSVQKGAEWMSCLLHSHGLEHGGRSDWKVASYYCGKKGLTAWPKFKCTMWEISLSFTNSRTSIFKNIPTTELESQWVNREKYFPFLGGQAARGLGPAHPHSWKTEVSNWMTKLKTQFSQHSGT